MRSASWPRPASVRSWNRGLDSAGSPPQPVSRTAATLHVRPAANVRIDLRGNQAHSPTSFARAFPSSSAFGFNLKNIRNVAAEGQRAPGSPSRAQNRAGRGRLCRGLCGMSARRGEPSRLLAPCSADRKSRVRYRLCHPRGSAPAESDHSGTQLRARGRRAPWSSAWGEQELGGGVRGRVGLNPRPLPGPLQQPFPQQTPGRKILRVQSGQRLPTLQKPPLSISAGGLPTFWGVERRDSGLLGTVGLPGSPGRCCGPAGPSRVTPCDPCDGAGGDRPPRPASACCPQAPMPPSRQ